MGDEKYPVDPSVQWAMDIMDQGEYTFETEVYTNFLD